MPQTKKKKAIVICLTQSKGGTAKTSSTLNIGACLVQAGYRVAFADLDQQASLTIALGIDPVKLNQRTMYMLLSDPEVQADEILVPTEEGIDLLPADLDLAMLEFGLKEAIGRERVLGRKLAPLKERYDFILIDTPPSFAISTLNGMAAADYILSPVQPEPLCLYGLRQLSRNLKLIQDNSNPNLRLLGVFISMYDSRLSGHREISEQIREDWGEFALNTIIRRRSNILQATVEGRSVITTNSNSDLAQDYKALTQEILNRV